jgi:phosphoglycerate kinase
MARYGREARRPQTILAFILLPSSSMTRDFFTLDDFDLAGKTVLLRVDINSPVNPSTGELLNDARLREHLVTIRDLHTSRVAILAHQSRPGKDDFTTMEQHAIRLSQLLGRQVRYVDALFSNTALEAIRGLAEGEIILMENTRFYAEEDALADAKIEKMAKSHMVRRLSSVAKYFVLDAFAAAHRAQPSLIGFADVMPLIAGRVMENELVMVGRVLAGTERPKIAILGGIKADDSIAVAKNVLAGDIVDKVLTTGGVANMFLVAKGVDIGQASVELLKKEIEEYDDYIRQCKELLLAYKDRILLPTDVAVNAGGSRKNIQVANLPSPYLISDIGLDTMVAYRQEIAAAKNLILNGPAGIFEEEEFSLGTRELFSAVAESEAFSVVGGGHTIAAVDQFGIRDRIDHVSTGGGALLTMLAGKEMPLIEALKRSKKRFGGTPHKA